MSETNWLVPALIANATALAMVTGLSALVLLRFPLPFFRAWVASLVCRTLAVALGVLAAMQPGQPWLTALVLSAMSGAAVCMVAAGLAYRKHPLGPRTFWGAIAGLVLAGGGLHALVPAPNSLMLVPGFAGYVGSACLVVWAFWPTARTAGEIGGRIVAGVSAAWVVESVVYPLLIEGALAWVAPMLVASGLLTVTVGMGMIVLLLEQSLSREHRLVMESREQTQALVRALDALARSRSEAAHHTTVAREQEALVKQIVHDLRNATQALQLIAESIGDATEDRADVQALMGAFDRQLTFISSFLKEKLVWIANRRPGPEAGTAVGPVFESLEATFRPIVATRSQHLSVTLPEGSERLRISAIELDQVLGNLLRNAHAHAGPGCHIRLWAVASDGWMTLFVSDDGPGLSWETQAGIGRGAPRADGTGVGLSNVFALVTRAGGAFGVISEPGAGATFHVKLPLTAWGEAPPPTAVEDGAQAAAAG